MLLEFILKTAVLPAVLLALALAALSPPWKCRPLPQWSVWITGMIPAILFAGAAVLVFGQFDPWPLRGDRRIPHAGLFAAIAAGLIGAVPRTRGIATRLAPPIALAAGLGLIAYPVLSVRLGPPTVAAWIAGLGIGGSILWWSTNSLAQRRPAALAPGVLAVAALAASIVLLIASSASLAQLAGTLCALMCASVVLCVWNPSMSLAGGAAPVAAALLAAILTAGHLYTQGRTPLASTLLLALSIPAAAAIPPRHAGAVGLVVAFSLAVAAVGWAILSADPVADLGF